VKSLLKHDEEKGCGAPIAVNEQKNLKGGVRLVGGAGRNAEKG